VRTYGRYSYAIYLLHRPILIGMNLGGLGQLALPRSPLGAELTYTAILMAASLLVGWLSWCVLEQPVQRLKKLFETGDRGQSERDSYLVSGHRTMLAFGPWQFEQPELGFSFRDLAGQLTKLRVSSASALPALVALSLLVVLMKAPSAAQMTLPLAVILLAGACAAVLLSVSRSSFLFSAAFIGVALLATAHGLYLAAIGTAIMTPIVVMRLASQRSSHANNGFSPNPPEFSESSMSVTTVGAKRGSSN
jgi:peptidoglycan/LPS O-acetylase OafA/YrhL